MRSTLWIAACVGCGQMYQAPGGQAPAPAPSAPGPAAPDPMTDPAARRSPTDPYAPYAAEPAAFPPRPAPAPAAFPQPPERAPAADVPADPTGPAEPAEPDDARRGGGPTAKPPRDAPAPRGDAQAFVDAHNRARARHCAGPLTWSAKLAQVAQKWANSLRDKGCAFGHSNGSYGENLAAGTSGTLDPEAVVAMWYDEISHYRFPDGGFSMQTGHFTQVVWRGTSQLGCGHSQCKGMDIWVCEYDPPGNWEGQYRENVLPRGCR